MNVWSLTNDFHLDINATGLNDIREIFYVPWEIP